MGSDKEYLPSAPEEVTCISKCRECWFRDAGSAGRGCVNAVDLVVLKTVSIEYPKSRREWKDHAVAAQRHR